MTEGGRPAQTPTARIVAAVESGSSCLLDPQRILEGVVKGLHAPSQFRMENCSEELRPPHDRGSRQIPGLEGYSEERYDAICC